MKEISFKKIKKNPHIQINLSYKDKILTLIFVPIFFYMWLRNYSNISHESRLQKCFGFFYSYDRYTHNTSYPPPQFSALQNVMMSLNASFSWVNTTPGLEEGKHAQYGSKLNKAALYSNNMIECNPAWYIGLSDHYFLLPGWQFIQTLDWTKQICRLSWRANQIWFYCHIAQFYPQSVLPGF